MIFVIHFILYCSTQLIAYILISISILFFDARLTYATEIMRSNLIINFELPYDYMPQYFMLTINKNIKDQRLARTARLRSKLQTTNQHSQEFNQFYFKIPEVHTAKNESKDNISHLKISHKKSITIETQDFRRNNIKQKIKFRIKQELWSLIKKNKDKQEQTTTQNQNIQTIEPRSFVDIDTFVCVQGTNFTRYNRNSLRQKKNRIIMNKNFRKEYCRSKTERQNTHQENTINRRRLWSSMRIKQDEGALVIGKQNKQCKNAFSLQRLQIQPWKSPDDSENHSFD